MHPTYAFVGAETGAWRVTAMSALAGGPLAAVNAVDLTLLAGAGGEAEADAKPGAVDPPMAPKPTPAWVLTGTTSNVRYATRSEVTILRAKQDPLGRPEARSAALIPIKKSAAWWDLAQDERRAIFEETSHHTAIGLDYLPAIARKLFHSRELGQPFDFLTWFEFAPAHTKDFDHLVQRLRETREWTYVEREIDIRLERA